MIRRAFLENSALGVSTLMTADRLIAAAAGPAAGVSPAPDPALGEPVRPQPLAPGMISPVLLSKPPFPGRPVKDRNTTWLRVSHWPGRWIDAGERMRPAPAIYLFRLRLRLAEPLSARIHVSGDEHYELFLDGHRAGRGPERGSAFRWRFDSYDLNLPAGEHLLLARVYVMGPLRGWGFSSARPGFLCLADDEQLAATLTTGFAPWECRTVDGFSFSTSNDNCGIHSTVPPNVAIDAASVDWEAWAGLGSGWTAPRITEGAGEKHGFLGVVERLRSEPMSFNHWLRPGMIGPQSRGLWPHARHIAEDGETGAWAPAAALPAPRPSETAVAVAAGSRRRVLIDLGGYLCAWPEIRLTGPGRATLTWVESLEPADPAASDHWPPDRWQNGRVHGPFDVFMNDGPTRSFVPNWWRCGRWLEVILEAGAAELRLEALALEETRAPCEDDGEWESDDPRLATVRQVALRTIQVCAHDAIVDCPYYEQKYYNYDSTKIMLMGYTACRDDALARSGLEHSADSVRNPVDLPPGSFPGVGGTTANFGLFAACGLADLAWWRGHRDFVRRNIGWTRRTVDTWLRDETPEGLAITPEGHLFLDALRGVRGWFEGEETVVGSLQLALTLGRLADLEEWLGESELAARYRRRKQRLLDAVNLIALDESLGVIRETSGQALEHAIILAILAGLRPDLHPRFAARLIDGSHLTIRCSDQLKFYQWEALAIAGHPDPVLREGALDPWFRAVTEGYATFPEYMPRTRSHSHAWNAHPLYHFAATVAGIRPGDWGFARVRITPRTGPLKRLRCAVPHPRGHVRVDWRCDSGQVTGTIDLPEGVPGELVLPDGRVRALTPGQNTV